MLELTKKRGIFILGDAIETMKQFPSNKVHLVVTSPKYNVGIDYGKQNNDSMTPAEYEQFTRDWILECYRILVEGGRLAINVGNTGRKPYVFLNKLIVKICLDELGMLARQEFIWYKGHSVAAAKTSWGSWCDAKNPVTRDCHEYIEVFSKNDYTLNCDGYEKGDVTGSEFAKSSFSVWEIKPSKIRWHPAPFPIEIPHRLINFYTRPGMIVLDPFGGSGNTVLAARRLGRRFIYIDNNEEYLKKARNRVMHWQGKLGD